MELIRTLEGTVCLGTIASVGAMSADDDLQHRCRQPRVEQRLRNVSSSKSDSRSIEDEATRVESDDYDTAGNSRTIEVPQLSSLIFERVMLLLKLITRRLIGQHRQTCSRDCAASQCSSLY